MQTTVNYAVLGLLDTVSAERITLPVVSCCMSTSSPPVSLLDVSFRSDSWSYCCIFRRIHMTTSLKSIRDGSCTLRVPTFPWLGLKPRPPPFQRFCSSNNEPIYEAFYGVPWKKIKLRNHPNNYKTYILAKIVIIYYQRPQWENPSSWLYILEGDFILWKRF